MDSFTATSGDSTAAPDWSLIHCEVLCPLCEYNLRGLVDPRCPECGHQFIWAELLDPGRSHPWLFDVQRRRRLRAFYHTFFVSLMPSRFWSSVRPTHTPNPVCLFLYWLVFAALACAVMVLPLVEPIVANQLAAKPKTIPRMMRNLDHKADYLLSIIVPVALMYLCWPGVTMLVLMIFRQTMRQARIKPDHVVRCVVYSSDGLVLMAIPLWILLVAMIDAGFYSSSSGWMFVGPLIDGPILLLLGVAIVLLTWRLATAYRMYLGFPHAIATCVLSQVIVALAMLTAYLTFATRHWP